MTWLLWGAGLLGACVLAEAAARWWVRHRGQYYVWLPGVRLHLHADREVLPEFQPVLRIEINSDGERGSEAHADERGLYRVLTAGGSAVEGHSLDQASNWPTLLEGILNLPVNRGRLGATRVHVGGIGRSAVTAQDVDLMLRRVLPRYRHLDAVLLMIGAGDVVKWLADGAPADAPAPPGTVSDLFAYHPEGPFGRHPSSTALWHLATGWRHRWLRRVETKHGVGRWIVEARAMRANASEIRTTVADPGVMADAFARHLSSSLVRASRRASRVLLLRTPWFEKDYTPEEAARLWHGALGHPWRRERISVYYAFDVINRLMALVDARAVQVAQGLGAEVVDLRSRLEPSLSNYYDYTHFTPAGARTVAEVVAAALLHQSPPMAAQTTARDRRGQTSVSGTFTGAPSGRSRPTPHHPGRRAR